MFISLSIDNGSAIYGVACIEKITPLSPPDAQGNMQVEMRFASGATELKTIHESEAEMFDRVCQHIAIKKSESQGQGQQPEGNGQPPVPTEPVV